MVILAIFQWKLLFWSLIILSDSNLNAINSSFFSSLWLHGDDRNLDFDSQPTNNIRQLPKNLTHERFLGNFSTNKEITSKNSKKEAGSSSDQRYDYDGTEQSITPLVENYMSSKRSKINSHSYRRSVTSVTNCTRYNEKYLYRLLERSGMLNQRFMANNPEEAGRNFALSYKNLFKAKSDYFDLPQDDSFQSDNINTSFVCNDLCQNIIRGLNEALRKEKNGTLLLRVPFLDDARLRTINDSSTNSTLTSCQLGMFIPVGKCIPQGTEEFEEHSKLCTSCGGVYVLDKMCFPRFINAIKCESQIQKSGCIFDKISTQPHGSCYMRTLTLEVLRNEGNEECQKWHYEYIQIPISCECQLNTESLLLSAVKP